MARPPCQKWHVRSVREKRGLEKVYVLFGALSEGGMVTPVQFEIEQYKNNENRLYLAVALTKIETGVKGNTAPESRKSTSLVPVSNISIAEIFSKINPTDKNFLKDIPNQFLNAEQIETKVTVGTCHFCHIILWRLPKEVLAFVRNRMPEEALRSCDAFCKKIQKLYP